MKKIGLIILILLLFFTCASVAASDVNETVFTSEYQNLSEIENNDLNLVCGNNETIQNNNVQNDDLSEIENFQGEDSGQKEYSVFLLRSDDKSSLINENITSSNNLNSLSESQYILLGYDVVVTQGSGTYSVTLKNSELENLKYKIVTFNLNGKSIRTKTDSRGVAHIDISNLPVGVYDITVTVDVTSIVRKIEVVNDDENPYEFNSSLIKYTSLRYSDPIIKLEWLNDLNGHIIVSVDGEEYYFNISSIKHDLEIKSTDLNLAPAQNINMEISFLDNDIQDPTKFILKTYKLNVDGYGDERDCEIIQEYHGEISDESVYEGNDLTIATLYYCDNDGKILIYVNKELVETFTLDTEGLDEDNDCFYEEIKFSQLGISSSGVYNIEGGYYKNGKYVKLNSFNISVTVDNPNISNEEYVLSGHDCVINAGDETYYEVTLKNSNGDALKNRAVTFTLNGNSIRAKTNSIGVASFSLKSLTGGKYIVYSQYASAITANKIIVRVRVHMLQIHTLMLVSMFQFQVLI